MVWDDLYKWVTDFSKVLSFLKEKENVLKKERERVCVNRIHYFSSLANNTKVYISRILR